VIEAAGLWMADQFSSDGFVWKKSRKTLERPRLCRTWYGSGRLGRGEGDDVAEGLELADELVGSAPGVEMAGGLTSNRSARSGER
jgi:hypothetical protein